MNFLTSDKEVFNDYFDQMKALVGRFEPDNKRNIVDYLSKMYFDEEFMMDVFGVRNNLETFMERINKKSS
jgi:UTP-glucose-1-phosphate uridylyltransferase